MLAGKNWRNLPVIGALSLLSEAVLDASDDTHARHYLIPGKIFAAAQPFAISTIVGSGIALCLWDSERRVGGANHFIVLAVVG